MPSALDRLTQSQQATLRGRLPQFDVVADMSWNLVETTVLRIATPEGRFVVKAGGAADHHIAREIRAHETWTGQWVATGHAVRMVHSDRDAKLVVTEFLPGRLVQDDAAMSSLDTYAQAGRILAAFHAQESVEDDGYERRANDKSLRWLAAPHRIEPDVAERLRAMIRAWPTPAATLVPTHGDWHSRNWIIDDGTVRVIDFGRADRRPAIEDFDRLAAREFVRIPGAEVAFLGGYGTDPREPNAWFRQRIRAAIGNAVWAFQVGDEAFEAEGHHMIAQLLGR
ncbi:phosphotransferase [Rhodococcus sp. SJ-3]|uniref:phosphotransferase n=1 Tax=Rhodococcus sp. SJ-3 TaxID=3454628 RepID=UPI003F798602